MKFKHYLLLKVCLDAALILFFLILLLVIRTTLFGWCIGIGLICFLTLRGFLTFKKIALTKEEEQVWQPPTDASAVKQIQFYKRVIILASIAFPALTLITILNLNSIESGEEASVQLIAPVAFLYHQCGYWIASLSVPVSGIVCVLLLMRKIRLLHSD